MSLMCTFQAFSKFHELREAISIHLVEVSETLSQMQEAKLSTNPDTPVQHSQASNIALQETVSTCTMFGMANYLHDD